MKTNRKNQIALLHCVTAYPVEYKYANLKAIETLRNNFNVVYRKYVMKYDYWLIDLNVTVNVEMGYVQNQLVPFNIHYNGFWDIPFNKPEIADFTLTNYDFEIIE